MKNTRSQRLQMDRFALISDVWYRFVTNSQQAYIPEEDLTADEQLFPSKARCPFTQYMSSKPDKFGIKFFLLVEVSSKYLCNGFPYLGKNESRPLNQPLGEFVILRLIEPYTNKGYNLTCDNFFTSLPLIEKLEEKKTTLVGTVRSNKKELPPLATETNKIPLYETQALVSNTVTLTIYKAKPNRNVIILSSRHEHVRVDDCTKKKKPNTIVFYNQTKYGVDILDSMAREYSVKPPSRRWPLHVFCNILDLAAINAWILYRKVTQSHISRREFLQELILELAAANQTRRSSGKTLPTECGESAKRVTCRVCYTNKTTTACCDCERPICGPCTAVTKKFCVNCV